jgi:MFS transporter, BCD family, chlorophyll transporter
VPPGGAGPDLRRSLGAFCEGDRITRHLVIIGIGTMAFAMADILLEPFGGEVLG